MAQQHYVETKVIKRVRRVGTSINGNPTYDVIFDDFTLARTQSDAAIAYEIANPKFQDATVDVTFTRAGRIAYVKLKGES